MILFIAPNPNNQKKIEGYLQRVKAIDELFENEVKIYSTDLSSEREILENIIKADLVYVHSIYKAKEIIEHYELFGYKIITDLHGAVPEEEALSGRFGESQILEQVEATVFKNSNNFVAVTEAMAHHYEKKYANSRKKDWIILPIYNSNSNKKSINKTQAVIYAGGAQKWQNIDLMAKVINNTANKDYRYFVLTQEPELFSNIINSTKNVTINSVGPSEVGEYYEQCTLGFVLRDDIIVNRVACPTKLIEYLEYGIVPIVKSAKIGDFISYGYKYINYQDFINKKLDKKTIEKYANINYKVLDKIKKSELLGKENLIKKYKQMCKIEYQNKRYSSTLIKILESQQHQSDKLHDLKNEIKNKNNEIENLKNEIKTIKNSKRWRMVQLIAKPVDRFR